MQALEGSARHRHGDGARRAGRGPSPGRLRRRRHQGRAPAGDGVRRMGWFRPERRRRLMVEAASAGASAASCSTSRPTTAWRHARLVDDADVLVENFRPGTLERLGLGPDVSSPRNPGLVVLRVTGFGQDGPYAGRPGFATMAEAMSGFAAINGEPDGPPLLPPIALTDEVAALAGAFAVMVALRHRDRTGEGQVVDVNLLESMLQCMWPLPRAWAHLGYDQRARARASRTPSPRDLPLRRRRVGRGVDVGRVGRAARARTRRRRRDERFHLRGPHGAPRGARASRWPAGSRPGRRPRCSRRSRRRRRRVRRCTRWPTCSTIRTCGGVFVEVDGVVMPGPVARSTARPAGSRVRGRPLGADTDEGSRTNVVPRRLGVENPRTGRPNDLLGTNGEPVSTVLRRFSTLPCGELGCRAGALPRHGYMPTDRGGPVRGGRTRSSPSRARRRSPSRFRQPSPGPARGGAAGEGERRLGERATFAEYAEGRARVAAGLQGTSASAGATRSCS